MDIPYTVKPRPDTGLFNAKLGIWLFLASEVMLFGALFSSYIMLRVGAVEGTWPKGVLNVPIGFFNTLVLIASSITVVQAWLSLRMNNTARFRRFMLYTVLCALTFLGIKSYEYREKFIHYQVWLNDGTTMTGHIEDNPWFWSTKTLQIEELNHIMFAADHNKSHDPDHEGEDAVQEGESADDGEHPYKPIATSDIKRLSAYVPGHSTYFAIYFILTGLHALHVIAGAAVLFYFMIVGARFWRTQPERMINRVEVGGLFWHFVDLVWIFLFPTLYLL